MATQVEIEAAAFYFIQGATGVTYVERDLG
jgi:hypothetical protein